MAFDEKAYAHEYYLKNKDKIKNRAKQWRIDNEEKYKKQNKDYYELNKDVTLAKTKEDRKINKEKYKEDDRKKYEKHKEKIIKRVTTYNKKNELRPLYMQSYIKKRIKNDIQFDLQKKIRSGLYAALKHNRFSKQSDYQIGIIYLGCNINELKIYLESKFIERMTWDNWGKQENNWQLDHIKPLCSFDLTDPEHLKEVCHYSNLQPLWVSEHRKKGKSLPENVTAKHQHVRKERESFKDSMSHSV